MSRRSERLCAKKPFPIIVMLLAIVSLAGCAGYQIGTKSLYPTDIHTVYVPIFESDSYRRELGEWLTEAIAKEIELKTPYKVVANPKHADTILSGKILQDTKRIIVTDQYSDPRQIEMRMVVEATWIDRRGQVIRHGQPVPLPEALATVTGVGRTMPEVGQSVVTAQQKSIQDIAEKIVSMMEAPW